MRAFCDICYGFQDNPFQAHKTEVRRFLIFSTTRMIIQKNSHQSLGSICVVSILERHVLQMHTTLKKLTAKI